MTTSTPDPVPVQTTRPRPQLPDRGTPLYDVLVSAIAVAAYPALKPGGYVFACQVPWERVQDLRSTLEHLGIDWQRFQAEDRRSRGFKP